jgi:3-mercaptopyruvate sulfurtransferase SseA
MSITADELLTHDPSVTIINAGSHSGSREIRGAIRYNPKELLDADHLALPISHDAGVVLYAEHGGNDELERIAAKFRSEGFADVSVYAGTLAEFEKAGGETQDASLQQVVPPSHSQEAK